MNKIVTILIFNLVCCSVAALHAQVFSYGELSLIKTQQIIIENYTVITMSKTPAEEPMLNQFDNGNPYTYLQVVKDMKEKSYHILYQTSFMGKLLFLAYSNNLGGVFNRPDKPTFIFSRCMREARQHVLSLQIADEVLKCILGRLNYCGN